MATTIRVNTGMYKNFSIKDQIFTLVGSPVSSDGRIQVINNGEMPTDVKKLTIYSNDFEVLDSARRVPSGATSFIPAVNVEKKVEEPVVVESDEQAMNRIATRFAILDKMTVACIASDVRALIVSGPPGVGKSFGVESQMEKYSTFDRLAGKKIRYEIVKGAMSALGLYSTLYKYSDAKSVVVFDDCDIFHDEDALNILKAALDSGKRRRIFWNTDSRKLRDEGIPNFFDFKGSVIFITNLNFSHARGKIAAHVEALQSRCHYLDLTINTERDRMLRIKQVDRDADGGLFKDYDFAAGEDQQILDYMWDHREQLSEVSMRMALKIADLVKVDPADWKMLTENTCFKHKR
jgi:predicted AAA+ superfamily ATPase